MEALSIVQIKPEDRVRIKDFLVQHFTSREPLNIDLNNKHANPSEFDRFIPEDTRFSLLALDSENNIAGVSLNRLGPPVTKPVKPIGKNATIGEKIGTFVQIIENGSDKLIPTRYDKLLLGDITSISVKYAGRSLGGKMWTKVEELARKYGCNAVWGIQTNRVSQDTCKKSGFIVVKVLRHEDYRDEEGNRIFNCTDGTDSGQISYKPLNSPSKL